MSEKTTDSENHYLQTFLSDFLLSELLETKEVTIDLSSTATLRMMTSFLFFLLYFFL